MKHQETEYRVRLFTDGVNVRILNAEIYVPDKGWREVHPRRIAPILANTDNVLIIGLDD